MINELFGEDINDCSSSNNKLGAIKKLSNKILEDMSVIACISGMEIINDTDTILPYYEQSVILPISTVTDVVTMKVWP